MKHSMNKLISGAIELIRSDLSMYKHFHFIELSNIHCCLMMFFVCINMWYVVLKKKQRNFGFSKKNK
jgi:hypothetical protein